MNFLFTAAAIICPIALGAVFFLFLMLKKEIGEVKGLRQQNADFLEQKSIAVTERNETEKKLHSALSERDIFLTQKDAALADKAFAEKQLALMQQHLDDTEKRMQDWELQRTESLKAAKASILEAGGQLSSKLLEDHKREAEAAKKNAEDAAKKNAEGLLEQMLTITQSVAALKEQTGQTQDKMSTVWRALTTPAGAGQLAEIGLENSLKNLGLEAGRDYVMQYVVGGSENSRLRPDAVVFLPQDMVMVIDSKASKFLLEIAEAEERGATAEELFKGLAQTMHKHLNDLKQKDYEAAIRSAYKESGRSNMISATHIVMCVPNEGAIAHMKKADPEFARKAEKLGVIIASPVSLFGLLSLAKHNMGLVKQSENHDLILKNVQQLMDNIITVLGYAETVGKGIKSAADNFDKFSRSVNRNVISKMQQLARFGIKPAKSKELPTRISGFELRVTEDVLTIEGESEMVADTTALEDFSKQKLSA